MRLGTKRRKGVKMKNHNTIFTLEEALLISKCKEDEKGMAKVNMYIMRKHIESNYRIAKSTNVLSAIL